jgi:hypothetical protein
MLDVMYYRKFSVELRNGLLFLLSFHGSSCSPFIVRGREASFRYKSGIDMCVVGHIPRFHCNRVPILI